MTDLTSQKALRSDGRRAALERSILQQAVDAIVVCDPDTRVIRASRAALELCGHNPILLRFGEAFQLGGERGAPDLGAVIAACRCTAPSTCLRAVTWPATCCSRWAGARRRRPRAGLRDHDDGHRRAARERGWPARRIATRTSSLRSWRTSCATRSRRSAAPSRSCAARPRREGHAAYAVEVDRAPDVELDPARRRPARRDRMSQGKIVCARDDRMRNVRRAGDRTCRPRSTTASTSSRSTGGSAVRCAAMVRLAQVSSTCSRTPRTTPRRAAILIELEARGRRPGEAVVRYGQRHRDPGRDGRAVFEPYPQVTGSRARDGGLGIGLTVVRRLMEMHGGSVEAHSEGPGRGAIRGASALAARAPASAAGSLRTGRPGVAARADRRRQPRRGRSLATPARDIGTRRRVASTARPRSPARACVPDV